MIVLIDVYGALLRAESFLSDLSYCTVINMTINCNESPPLLLQGRRKFSYPFYPGLLSTLILIQDHTA